MPPFLFCQFALKLLALQTKQKLRPAWCSIYYISAAAGVKFEGSELRDATRSGQPMGKRQEVSWKMGLRMHRASPTYQRANSEERRWLLLSVVIRWREERHHTPAPQQSSSQGRAHYTETLVSRGTLLSSAEAPAFLLGHLQWAISRALLPKVLNVTPWWLLPRECSGDGGVPWVSKH